MNSREYRIELMNIADNFNWGNLKGYEVKVRLEGIADVMGYTYEQVYADLTAEYMV